MALIALTSAKGAPGVTTTAIALAIAWPRPCLLLEADVAGTSSILAGYFRGAVTHDRGLIDLAEAHRRGALTEGLHRASIPLNDQSHARVVPGLRSPAQAPTMVRLWEPLAAVLQGLESTGTDVLIDAGRYVPETGPLPLLREADLTLLVTQTGLPAIAAARVVAGILHEDLMSRGTGEDALRLLTVGEGRPFSNREAKRVINLPVAASITWDPEAASVLSDGAQPGRRWTTSSLVRSARAAAATLNQLIGARRTRLDPGAVVDHEELSQHA